MFCPRFVICHSSFVIDSSFDFRHSNLSQIRRMAFEVACVVADRRPGMLRDDASDFICVSRDQANLSLETNAIATEKSPDSVLADNDLQIALISKTAGL